jgi:hypothetical protein
MLNKNERMEMLKKAGVNTDKYFTVDLDNGTKIHLIIDENGDCVQVKDPIFNQIIEDGYVRNTKLHRRFVMAQMFHMLNYVSYDGKYRGYNDCLKKMYGYDYTFQMMLEEVRVLSKLEARDIESFEERSHFFTKAVVVAVLEDYLEKLKKYVDCLPNKNCKGVPYKKVKGVNIFNDDLDKKVYYPVKVHILNVKIAKSYSEMYKALANFMRDMIKLPYDTPKSKDWVDAYKGEGAYYTIKNLVMFHGCNIISDEYIDYGVNSIKYLKSRLNAYSGEGWRMFALMKKVIADNHFDFYKKMDEIYNN